MKSKNLKIPVLYILMRDDLPSMNAGKAMAQAAHAANAFIHSYGKVDEPNFSDELAQWQNETNQGFGTTIVLSCDFVQMNDLVVKALNKNLPAGRVYDPTYPYKVSGEIANVINKSNDFDAKQIYTLVRPEYTCGYIFGDKDGVVGDLVKDLSLHP